MAKIRGSGATQYGKIDALQISGEKTVEMVKCSESWMEEWIRKDLQEYDGAIANDYHPKKGSMLQAYIFMMDIFGADNVFVDGDIGTIPYKEGVIF